MCSQNMLLILKEYTISHLLVLIHLKVVKIHVPEHRFISPRILLVTFMLKMKNAVSLILKYCIDWNWKLPFTQ